MTLCVLLAGAVFRLPDARAQDRPSLVAPAPIGSIEVAYPRGAHGEAEVSLELLIAEDGTVARATVREGESPFAEAARIGAEAFRFTPATRNGIPVRARIAVRIVFREPKPIEVPEATPAPALETAESPPAASEAQGETAAPLETPAEIVVLGEQRAELGSIHIPKEEARRVPGAFGDPFRVVEILPGVTPLLSGLPYYHVRGAPPGDVGYFIDGIRVPLLFHVGPGPSVIAPALTERVDLFPGAYPARFGRYAGAIFSGETAGPGERLHAEAQARIFDASGSVETPFANGRGSALLAGRYSFTQAILAAVAPDYKLGYGDYQARVTYSSTRRDRFTVFGFGGSDLLRNKDVGVTLFDVTFHRLDLRWDHSSSGGRIRLATTLSSDRVLAGPDDPGSPGTAQRNRGARLRGEIEQDLLTSLRVRAGGDLAAERVSGEREQIEDTFESFAKRTDLAAGVWADLLYRPVPGIEIAPGARFDRQRSRGHDYSSFDPRLSVRTRLAGGFAHLAGFGMAHQLPTVSIRMPGRRPEEIERFPQTAVHANQGLEYALPDGMLGRTTLFFQHVEVEGPPLRGRSFGVEQFLRRDFTHRLGGVLSYTLSRAEGISQREVELSSFDRTHVISATLGYDFGGGYRAGIRGYYNSGRAYQIWCPTTDCGPLQGRYDPQNPGSVRKLRLPSFFRLDLRIEKRWQFNNGFWVTAAFEWFNSLITAEVRDVNYTPQGGLAYEKQSPLTLPSIGVELGY